MSSLASPSGEGGGQARAGGNRRRDDRCASRWALVAPYRRPRSTA